MDALELKNNFHHLIDEIENERFLWKFYNIMKRRLKTDDGELWATLSKEEQEELLLAEQESKDSDNLLSFDDVKKKHEKWL